MLRCVALLACLAAAPAIAQTAPAAAPANAAKPVAVDDSQTKICRRETGTGTIMSTRTCRTKAQWAKIDAENGESAQRALSAMPGRGAGGLGGQ